MKHLKKLFIVALCAQAYTANAALDWQPLNDMVKMLQSNVGVVTDQINKVNDQNTQLRVIAQNLENEKNQLITEANEQISIAQSGSKEDENYLNAIVENIANLNKDLSKAFNNVQKQNQNFQNQRAMDVEDNQGQGIQNQNIQNQNFQNQNVQNQNVDGNVPQVVVVDGKKKKVGSQDDLNKLTTMYNNLGTKLKNAPSITQISQVDKPALKALFEAAYPDEQFPDNYTTKKEYLDYIYGIADKYGFIEKK